MTTPVDIKYRGMTPSPALDTAVHQHVARLERLHQRIHSCHVWIEVAHHGHSGQRFAVHLRLALPGHELAVTHDSGHEDAYLAVADAFIAAKRRLVDLAQIARGEVKQHRA